MYVRRLSSTQASLGNSFFMRRVIAPLKGILPDMATTTTTAAHRHGGKCHGHSHGAIEKGIVGKTLRDCQMATIAGGATNVFFCISKLWFGTSGGSVALVADGFHALTDILADIVSYVSISLSRRKYPRCRFPFGIGRLETTGAVLVAAILLAGGITLLFQSFYSCVAELGTALTATTGVTIAASSGVAGAAFLVESKVAAAQPQRDHGNGGHNEDDHDHGHSHGCGAAHGHSHFDITAYDEATGEQVVVWTMVLLAATSVVCKELLFRWTRRVGKRAGSRVVIANAYHHRADAWSGGVALLGVAGQMAGIPGIDGIAGLVVSLSICHIGHSLLRESIMEFFDCQNANDVSMVREKLQEFHLHVTSSGGVVEDKCGSSLMSMDSQVSETRFRFVNVFLMRHGPDYSLHVKLLVHENLTALQVQIATQQLTALAKTSLPIQDTFISLVVCSRKTMSRSQYIASFIKDGEDLAHSNTDAVIAAEGDEVSPSLEECLRALSDFHGFSKHITYDWASRVIKVPVALQSECGRDVESVAMIFKCTIAAPKPSHSESLVNGHINCGEHDHSL